MSSEKDATQKFNGATKKLTGDVLDLIHPGYLEQPSYQILPADLNVAVGGGSDIAGDPSYIAAIMGNILGDELTKDQNYLAGVIGAYSITGVKATTYPAGAVLAQITDGVTEADGAVVAYIDGDGSVTKANAAFKGMSNNSTPGSGFDYGLDLHGEAHDGYNDLAILKADVRMSHEVSILNGEGVPTDGVAGTGAGFAEISSEYHDRTNGDIYVNAGTKASPAWKAQPKAGLFGAPVDLGPFGTNARDKDVDYQNTTGKAILLMVNTTGMAVDTGGGDVFAFTDLYVENATPPSQDVYTIGPRLTASLAGQQITNYGLIVFIVPAGYYYRIESNLQGDQSVIGVAYWYEQELF
jgi:hypothetical protein